MSYSAKTMGLRGETLLTVIESSAMALPNATGHILEPPAMPAML
jgi:hypothetical protein